MRGRWRRWALGALAVLLAGYGAIVAVIWRRAETLLAQPPQRSADAALVLGNRAYLHGRPTPA